MKGLDMFSPSPNAKSFGDLIVWQKAHQFVLEVYKYTKQFPEDEIYCLTAQFRRAAISIAANIAEGFKKRTRKDKIRYLNISQGSTEECRYYLILSRDLDYGENAKLLSLVVEVSKMLDACIRTLEN
jgi:four helix bundle protein